MKIDFQSFLKTPILILFLVVVGLLAYAQTIYYPFVHDDVVFIQNNPTISSIDLKEIFLRAEVQKPADLINAYYRPILDVVYRLEYKLFHLNPSGYHLMNVLLHIGNSLLIFMVLQIIFKNIVQAFIIALIFLVHPVQTEAVACVVGISNLLFSFFFVLSVYHYLKRDKNRWHAGLSLFYFLLALFTKEQAVVLPVLLLMYEFIWGQGNKRIKKFQMISGHLIILCFYFVFRKIVVGHSAVDLGNLEELKLRLFSIPATILMYLKILMVPTGLHYYRSTDILLPALLPMIALGGILALIVLTVRNLERVENRIVCFGLGWFIIVIFPTLNLLPLVNEYSLILTSEHFLYLPMVGIAMVGVGYFSYLQKQFDGLKNALMVVMGLLVLTVIYFSMTVKQNTYWRSEVALFERMILFEKNFARGHILLARAYYFDRQLEKSAEQYDKARERLNFYLNRITNQDLKGFYEGFVKECYFEAAHVYQLLGNNDKTLFYYQQLIKLDPNFSKAHINLGVFYVTHGKPDLALQSFKRAADINPYDPMAWQNLMMLYQQIGDRENFIKAVEMMKRAQELNSLRKK